jgi:hypothetical protein
MIRTSGAYDHPIRRATALDRLRAMALAARRILDQAANQLGMQAPRLYAPALRYEPSVVRCWSPMRVVAMRPMVCNTRMARHRV